MKENFEIDSKKKLCIILKVFDKKKPFVFSIYLFIFILLYNTVLVLPYIDMNPPQAYMSSQSWTPLPPLSPVISLGHPSAPAPSILDPVSNLDWRFISYMIAYMFNDVG